MATRSIRTIRIRGIDEAFTTESFTDICSGMHEAGEESSITNFFSKLLHYKSSSTSSCLGVSLALQNGYKIATASFTDQSAKIRATKYNFPVGWEVDDRFDGITVLHSPTTERGSEIDICAVHGLQGNAFDAWEAGSEKRSSMWLRDMLPNTPPFNRARIMTFGYSSQLRDRNNISEIGDWADYLLLLVGGVRRTLNERKRPIIFVCHSLGGIVAREAMVRLDAHAEKYTGIRIENCGLLFLGTPHSGTTLADWNIFLSGIAAVGGVRTDVIAKLRSFNGFGVESKEAFSSIKNRPPHYCLCETRLINIGGSSALVVTKDSAGLNEAVAFPMPDVDHREICKYESKFVDGYSLVVDRLARIRGVLMKENSASHIEAFEELPGHPPVTAERFPLPSGKAYYEGKGLLARGGDRLVGRITEYSDLQRIVSEMIDGIAESTAIAISGIGGIGKTELLLSLAHRYRNKCNFFFLRPNDAGSFTDSLLSIANNIGSELLAKRHPKRDLYSLWSELEPLERMEAFHYWLSAQEIENSFLLLDDVDAAGAAPRAAIEAVLPQQPRNLLITTRNPVLVKDLEEAYHLKVHYIRLTDLAASDIVEYTSRGFKNFLGDDDNDHSSFAADHIETIAQLAIGHPLVASRIVSFIATNLREQYGAKAVEHFILQIQTASSFRRIPAPILTYRPTFQCSIAETFETSRNRLPRPNGSSWVLMQLIAFMVQNDSAFIQFLFFERPWVSECEGMFAFHDIWSANPQDKHAWMSNLRKVSLGTATSQNGLLHFHPVLIQYIQEQIEHGLRISILRDIMLLALESIQRTEVSSSSQPPEQDPAISMLSAQALHCARICRAYDIENLGLAPRSDRFFELAKAHVEIVSFERGSKM
ncbi:hypothetical protein N431DRAFT_563751 [Stipitochalara longipes BDJ]|nr:hypothetical protein N431DRAFT_563751 [Stipitochalara longipes BDJ]